MITYWGVIVKVPHRVIIVNVIAFSFMTLFLISCTCSITGNEDDIDNVDPKKTDPEYFAYECLTVDEVFLTILKSARLLL